MAIKGKHPKFTTSNSKKSQKMKVVKYIRVSTVQQNTDRQQQTDLKTYIDKISGSVSFAERPQAKKLLQAIDKGQVNEIHVHAIDRLGRNQIDILNTIQFLTTKGVNLFIENLGIYSIVDGKVNPAFNLIISVLSSIAQMEKEQIAERTQEGREIAKAKGKYLGRKVGSTDSKEKTLSKHPNIVVLIGKGLSVREIAKATKTSTKTVQKVINLLRKDELQPQPKEEVKQAKIEIIGAI